MPQDKDWATKWITSPTSKESPTSVTASPPWPNPALLNERHFVPAYAPKPPLQQVKLGTYNEMREHEQGMDKILTRMEEKRSRVTPNSPTLLDRVSPQRERPYSPSAPPSPYGGARHTSKSPFYNSPGRGGVETVQDPSIPHHHSMAVLEQESEKNYQQKRVEYEALIEQAEHRIARQ